MADDTPPRLIIHVSEVDARTQFILPNADYIRGLPIDGISINIPESWQAMSPGHQASRADIRNWLEPLRDFNDGMTNYLALFVDRPGDLTDDAAWATAARNWRLLASVAREVGFVGFVFDNEEYMGKFQDYSGPLSGLDAARELAAQRGRELGAALGDGFPDAELMVMHGPYTSVPQTDYAPDGYWLQTGGRPDNELRGPLFTGMVEGIGPDARIFDGGELYYLRDPDEFAASVAFRDRDVPRLIDWMIDPDLRADWADRIEQGHMVYTDEFPPGFGQTPDTFTLTTLAALDKSEGLVTVFSDSGTVRWLNPAAADQDWIAALALARDWFDQTATGDADPNHLRGRYGGAADRLIGGGGHDLLLGRAGRDLLLGGKGDDVIRGGRGGDSIAGGAGDDTLSGGQGADCFILTRRDGTDAIIDFEPGRDRLMADGRVTAVATDDGLLLTLGRAQFLLHGVTAGLDDLTIL